MRTRLVITTVIVATMMVGSSACAPNPTSQSYSPISVGACVQMGTTNLSFWYLGSSNTFHNVSVSFTPDCSGPAGLILATVVFAPDSAAALAACAAADAGLTNTQQLSLSGWVISGSSTPISDQVWACGP